MTVAPAPAPDLALTTHPSRETVDAGGRPPADAPPPAIPGYDLLAEIGRGATARVFRARHRATGTEVALKTARPGPAFDPDALRRFAREAEALAAVRHPNVVRRVGGGCAAGVPYLALELCPGGDLKRHLAAGRPAPAAAAGLAAAVARAAAAAHAAGLVHLDLKPENVLFAADGTVRVADFGLARRPGEADPAADGRPVGTPAYLSPEQAAGRLAEVGPATDVWAVGVVLYECLTGRRPFDGGNVLAVLRRVAAGGPPVPPSAVCPGVPAGLEDVCLTCLRTDPAARFAGGAELAEALARWA